MTRQTPPPAVAPVTVADRFAATVREHTMTILADDGLYRHLRFQAPGTSLCYFDIVTWPYRLVIEGDIGGGGWMFGSGTDDMLGFFRCTRIHPGYWAEKVRAGGPVRDYSAGIFRQCVLDYLDGWLEAEPDPAVAAAVRAAVTAEVLDNPDIDDGTAARLLVRDFAWYRPPSGPGTNPKALPYFTFDDTGEWDLTDFGYWYLFACHAVQWAVTRYDTTRSAR